VLNSFLVHVSQCKLSIGVLEHLLVCVSSNEAGGPAPTLKGKPWATCSMWPVVDCLFTVFRLDRESLILME